MIDSERLNIIPLEVRHLKDLRKMRNDFSTWYWLTDPSPINEINQNQWFGNVSQNPKKMYFAIEDNRVDSFIGMIRSDEWDRVNRSVRIGIDIATKFRKKGYGTEAFQAFIDYLFLHQNMNRIWFFVVADNKPARGLYKKIGFKQEGIQRKAIYRDGKYHNYVMMSLLAEEYFNRSKEKTECVCQVDTSKHGHEHSCKLSNHSQVVDTCTSMNGHKPGKNGNCKICGALKIGEKNDN